MKLRQYEQGKRFCDAVAAEAGIEGLNRVWESPEALPSPERAGGAAQLARARRPGPRRGCLSRIPEPRVTARHRRFTYMCSVV